MRECLDQLTIHRFLLGDLPGWESAEIEEHLAWCADCSQRLDALAAEDGLVEAMRCPSPILSRSDRQAADRVLRRFGELPHFDSPTPYPAVTPSFPAEPDCSQEALGSDEVVGRYRLREILGRGGMGVVYRAEDPWLRREVAVKLIRDSRSNDPGYRERFGREAKAATLRHPNIVQIYEVGESDGRPYFVMEYLPGGTLAQRLAGQPQAVADSATTVATLARGVHVAHEAGVIHRDLKPANVLLTNDADVKIADFGLARSLDEQGLTETGDLLGTPGYMAPELAHGVRGVVGSSVDIYGLGAILYEMLTGRPPFRGASVVETLEQVRTQDPVSPRRLRVGVPRDLETVCLKCLHQDPQRRYSTAAELADDLDRFLQGKPVKARPVGAVEWAMKWARRRPALACLLVVSLVALTLSSVGAAAYEYRLRKAWREAQQSEQVAQRESERADSNYRHARETLNRVLEQSKNRAIAGQPRLRDLQRRQGEEALRFYLDLSTQNGENPRLRLDTAWAGVYAGRLQQELGRTQESLASYREALRRFLALVEEFPNEAGYRAGLADCITAIASVDGLPESESDQMLTEALNLFEQVVREDPTNREYRDALAAACNNLAAVRLRQHRTDEGLSLYRRAIAIREELLREQPNDHRKRVMLAESKINLCDLYRQQHDRPQARRLFDEAKSELEHLIREAPDELKLHDDLARLRLNWTYEIWREEKNPQAALDNLAENAAALEAVLREEPNFSWATDTRYRTYGLTAQILGEEKRYVEAVVASKKAYQLAPNEAIRSFHRLFLAQAHAKAGQHADAYREAKACAEQRNEKTSWEEWQHLATVFALSTRKASEDSNLSALDREQTIVRYSHSALECLQKARKTIPVQKWADVKNELKNDADFALVRRLPGWAELIKP